MLVVFGFGYCATIFNRCLHMFAPSRIYLACRLASRTEQHIRRPIQRPRTYESTLCTVLPNPYWITPLNMPLGLLTTTSPSRMSIFLARYPSTNTDHQSEPQGRDVERNWVATLAADITSVTPIGKHAMAMLCVPTRLKVQLL